MKKIPFVDLHAQYLGIKSEIDEAISKVIAETAFIKGHFVSEFEEQFAKFVGGQNCIGCANGTDAIEIILKALDIGPGDEVLVPANSFIATSEAVSSCGAIPVFVEHHPTLYTIDPTKIEQKITPRTRAIIPVHLYGLPAEMNEVCALAKKHSLLVIEDSAQAHGARYRGKRIGTFGDAATFSFFPGKNLGAYGDAGAIITNNSELAEKCRMIANHGRIGKYDHVFEGRNSRLDGLQAAILSVKLKHIDSWNELRRAHAKRYNELLADSSLELPVTPEHLESVFHLYVVRSTQRDALQRHLNSVGIECGVHYPIPLPFLKAYERFHHTHADFPVAAEQMAQILSLPMFPELTDAQMEHIVNAVREFDAAGNTRKVAITGDSARG